MMTPDMQALEENGIGKNVTPMSMETTSAVRLEKAPASSNG